MMAQSMSSRQSREVVVDGVPIVATDVGAGVPIVLMHGVPDTRHSWSSVVEHLHATAADRQRYRIIAPDYPGFGDSPEPPPDFDFRPAANAVLWRGFMDEMGIDQPAVVCVHDFGGPWLLGWVAAQPERVRGALLLNTLFFRDFRWHVWARIWQTRGLGELSMILANRWLMRREMSALSPGLSRAAIDETYQHFDRSMKRTILRCYRMYRDMDEAMGDGEERLQAALARIPTRVLWGQLDPNLAGPYADRFSAVPERLEDVGHWVYLERPERVAEHLRELADGG